jgi:hypothetical protein
VAVNCCVFPAATDGLVGVTAIEVKTAAVTVNVAVPLILPEVAVIVAVPALMPFASPVWKPTVAVVVLDEVQFAVVVRFCVEPSLKVPVAVNCWVLVTTTDAELGETAIEVRTGAVPVPVSETV